MRSAVFLIGVAGPRRASPKLAGAPVIGNDNRIGVVCDFGFAKIFVNVAKCASGFSSFDTAAALVEGTLRMPFENCASAWLFVVRYFVSCHAASRFLPFLGMPMIVPLM